MIGVVAVVVEFILQEVKPEMVVLVEVVEVALTVPELLMELGEQRHLIFPILPLLDQDHHYLALEVVMDLSLLFLAVMVVGVH